MIKPNFITKEEKVTDYYARFIFEPLPISFGHSLGNILRRTLLSSIKGAAITDVKFSQATHIFTTIKGIKESILEIILNLKQLRFKTVGEGPFKIYFENKKRGKIYGKDITGELEIVNKDLYLFEITDDKVDFQFEAIVKLGYGFSDAELREEKESQYIAVDAFFSPIKKVNFRVEPTRIGKRDDYERLILEIWSDGTKNPKEALIEVCQGLSKYFSHFFSLKSLEEEKNKMTQQDEEDQKKIKDLENVIIDELNFPSRVINALLKENIETVADLIKAGRKKIESTKGVGTKSLKLIDLELKKIGVELK